MGACFQARTREVYNDCMNEKLIKVINQKPSCDDVLPYKNERTFYFSCVCSVIISI